MSKDIVTTEDQQTPVDRLVMPPSELIDLVRFLCATWSEIDELAYRDTGDAIMFYPVVQGTRNQMDLRLIGQQKYNSQNVAKAVRWMIDHQYMLDRSAERFRTATQPQEIEDMTEQATEPTPSAAADCSPVSRCWLCDEPCEPDEVICESAECVTEHQEILADEDRCYRKELWQALVVALKERCKKDGNHHGRLARWAYTLKLLVCVAAGRHRPRGLSYPGVVEVGHHHYAKLYAGWEASWIAVGAGVFSGWWYEIQRDGDWCM